MANEFVFVMDDLRKVVGDNKIVLEGISLSFFPLLELWRRFSLSELRSNQMMPALTCAVCVLIVLLYNIPNASDNPAVKVMIGGLAILRPSGT